MEQYDLAVIGGGPGGYAAAIRAAKLGGKVALVEARELGGTCLNRGCIPSKTLLRHAEVIEQIQKAKQWGIETGELSLSLEKMMKRKNQIIKRLRTGIAALLKAGKIDHYSGQGTVHPERTVSIQATEDDSAPSQIKANNIILATGSVPLIPPIAGIEQSNVHTSDTIFDIATIPETMTIVGGGFIGVEFACIFSALGVKVTVVEMADRIIPMEDEDAARVLTKALQKKGVRVLTSAMVEEISTAEEGKRVTVQAADGKREEIVSEEVLVATARKPNVSGLEKLQLQMDKSYVVVNDRMQTSHPGVYAIGDLIGGWQLAHVAVAEGHVAAENAMGQKQSVDYTVVPRVIYTSPEIASVGMTEAEAKRKGYDIKVQKVDFIGNGKALTMDEKDGFTKIIADKKYGQILGVVMAGAHVTEMISEASAFILLEGTTDELAKMIHPHPTLSEAMFEGAAAWLGKGVHY